MIRDKIKINQKLTELISPEVSNKIYLLFFYFIITFIVFYISFSCEDNQTTSIEKTYSDSNAYEFDSTSKADDIISPDINPLDIQDTENLNDIILYDTISVDIEFKDYYYDDATYDILQDYADIETLEDNYQTDISFNPCPDDMANVENIFCIDKYEGALEELINGEWQPRSPYLTVGNSTVRAIPAKDIYPQAYISGKEAEIACKNSGKRLCSLTEWLTACQGPYKWIYPYGNQYEKDFCNDTYISGHHPLCDYFKLNPCDPSKLNYQQFNDPGINQMPETIAKGGEFSLCQSYYGVYDMHGNLHEWISDPNGTFKGGFYGDSRINGNGCYYTTTAHEFTYHDYSTGFRCCKDISN